MAFALIGIISLACMIDCQEIGCDEGFIRHGDHCYILSASTDDWNSAVLECEDMNNTSQSLVHIGNDDLNTFLLEHVLYGKETWIGLNMVNPIGKRNWTWSDGTQLTYEGWIGNDVIDVCAVMKPAIFSSSGVFWYSQQCSSTLRFICEKDIRRVCEDWRAFTVRNETHCYFISGNNLTMSRAAAAIYCWERGSYLVSVNNREEAQFLRSQIVGTSEEFWIGLAPFKWIDGSPYQWHNFDNLNTKLNRSCVYINGSTGHWMVGNCNVTRRFLCQQDARHNADITTASMSSLTTDLTNTNRNLTASTLEGTSRGEFPLLAVILPVVLVGVVIVIIIIVAVIMIRRRQRTPTSKTVNFGANNEGYGHHEMNVYDHVDTPNDTQPHVINNPRVNAHGHNEIVYDAAEIVQLSDDTIVVNGDVYAIVDISNRAATKETNASRSPQGAEAVPQINNSQEIAKGQKHIVVGTDVYALVNKENVKSCKQNKLKQKKKKPSLPPQLGDMKHETDEENVYDNEFDIGNATNDKSNRKNQKQNIGIVYADLDLTSSLSVSGKENVCGDDTRVVYADVRG